MDEFWEEVTPNGDNADWYQKSTDYWKETEASVNGVLGNFGHLTNIDVKESKAFLLRVRKSQQQNKKNARLRVLDCGAGVGRTAQQLLAPLFDKVDLVEQDERFLRAAKKRVPPKSAGKFYCKSLQEFKPTLAYSVVWVQWVLNYLTDADLVAFFERVAGSLIDNGVVFVKENMLINPDDDYKFDSEDSSVTRSDKHFELLFAKAGLRVVDREQQKIFPTGMLPVIMYALVVDKTATTTTTNEATDQTKQDSSKEEINDDK